MNNKLGGRSNSTPLGSLVTTPLTSFLRLFGKEGDLEKHASREYHKKAVLNANDFLKNYDNPNLNVINQADTGRKNIMKENRARLLPIIKTIIFLGKQNIPFRGHRDDGVLENNSAVNEGNFRALLKFRIDSGDYTLKKHLEESSSRATYISKTTQNELIECCGREILSNIIQRIQAARLYSVMFDETTDCSNKSQLSLILRYTDCYTIYESFVQFIDAREKLAELKKK